MTEKYAAGRLWRKAAPCTAAVHPL